MADSVFGFEKPEQSPGFLLWQTMVLWQRQVKKALDPFKLSHAQFVVLANLLWFEASQQQPTQALMVRSTKLDKMTVSKALQKLISEDLIKRWENKEDTRAKTVALTAKGRALTNKLVPLIEKVDEKFFAVLAPTKQHLLVSQLAELVSKSP